MKPKVSVIVPVYNVEAYLEECLISIVNQTFNDIEIILIDDGSTDLSSDIMNDFAQKDNRIITYSQMNQGVSAARNTGVSLALGEYILFVDSDDSIVENTIEIIYKKATETNADIVIGNVLYSYPDGKQIPIFQRPQELNNIHKISGDICFMELMELNAYPPLVYLFFIKREFITINELYFKKNIIHEDELWCIQTLFYAKCVSIIDFYYYRYRQREGSIMNSDNGLHRVKSILSVVYELDMLAKKLYRKEELLKKCIDYIYVRIFFMYLVISRLLKEKNEDTLSIVKFFSDLLIKIYPTLTLHPQKKCLGFYHTATSNINRNIQ